MKILVIGDWHSELHEDAVFNAFDILGHDVEKFAWCQYFKAENLLEKCYKKAQNRFLLGPLMSRLNNDFYVRSISLKPDLIFIYRGTHIWRKTIVRIKQALLGVIVVGYNNDDPFSKEHDQFLWRHFLSAIPEYDLIFAYRHRNINEFYKAGAKRVELLRSWYIPNNNYPIELLGEEKQKYECDVVFIGHYEKDGREDYIKALIDSGFSVKVFGPEWPRSYFRSQKIKKLGNIVPVRDVEYNKALSGAKIALCFLSKLNRDTYTRRCFEIPATKTVLCSERTDDLMGLYEDNKEAIYFDSIDELVEKVKQTLNDEELLKSISEAGFQKVQSEGHDVVSRMKKVLELISTMKSKK